MNKVKEIRTKAGLTQNQLAAKTGGKISQGDISKLETGYFSKPQPKVLRIVAEVLGVTENELFPGAK
jgi:transcriptional regulator with XRE-family HTH domain